MRPAALLLLAAAGCVDLGYALPPEPDAAAGALDTGTSTTSDGGVGCVHGPTSDLDQGVVVRVLALNVDRRTVNVPLGGVVTWVNEDGMRHGMVAGAPGALLPPARGGFDTGEFGFGERRGVRLCQAGTFVYFCSTHPAQMTGYRIIVE